MKRETYDVAIIGGGASGIAAAIELKLGSPNLSVVIIEKNTELGKKIRATGNGRCNITNVDAEGYSEIMSFFRKIGIVTRTYDNNLVYPYSESAADVVELLTARVNELGVDIITQAAVNKVEKSDDIFTISFEHKDKEGTPLDEKLTANKVILSTGGKAGPNYGTTGDGYAIAKSLGHSVVTPIPVLTSIECKDWDKSLGGIRARAKVSLYKDETESFDEDTKIFEESGEVQFTKFGLSGICIFNMTRHMRYDRTAGESLDQFLVKLDLFADGDIDAYIKDRKNENLSTNHLLRTILKPELADYVERRGIEKIHSLEFHPASISGWKDAQATSGGVSLNEIDSDTCESKLCSNLYITGELLDYDGPCGGFNLSNAWITGLKVANKISNK